MRELQVRNTRIAVSLDEPGAYAAMEAIVGSPDGAHVLQRTAGHPQCFSVFMFDNTVNIHLVSPVHCLGGPAVSGRLADGSMAQFLVRPQRPHLARNITQHIRTSTASKMSKMSKMSK